MGNKMKAYNAFASKTGYQMPVGTGPPDHNMPAHDVLQDYELRFRTMAENMTLGMFQVAPVNKSQVLSANHVMAQMLGYQSPEELSGKPARDLIIPSADFDNLAREVMRDGSVVGREIRLKRNDGSDIWVSVQAWKLKTAHEPGTVIECLVEDVTEHLIFEQEMRYHESELNRYALALAQANKKLNLLSNITRHDILNKLTGLQGYLELMKVGFTDSRLQEYLTIQEKIIQTITLQIRFTKDYQDIGIESPRWFNVQETIANAAVTLPLNSINLTVETSNLQVYADPLLEKVFYNLIENAIRHGGNLTRISFHSIIDDEGARIICEDDGSGVPEQYKEAIFLRKHFKNTGFGLYLSQEILGITGLSIREDGKPDNGARFEITIPRENFRVGETDR
jgi:PAS domain S-box-containing protein